MTDPTRGHKVDHGRALPKEFRIAQRASGEGASGGRDRSRTAQRHRARMTTIAPTRWRREGDEGRLQLREVAGRGHRSAVRHTRTHVPRGILRSDHTKGCRVPGLSKPACKPLHGWGDTALEQCVPSRIRFRRCRRRARGRPCRRLSPAPHNPRRRQGCGLGPSSRDPITGE